ncbi:MAG: terminase small subunit [Vulcanimicrobiota bacterium]
MGNATSAAVAAGYSEKSARQTAWDLLNLPAYAHVQAAVQARQEAHLKKFQISHARTLEHLAYIAYGDPRVWPPGARSTASRRFPQTGFGPSRPRWWRRSAAASFDSIRRTAA